MKKTLAILLLLVLGNSFSYGQYDTVAEYRGVNYKACKSLESARKLHPDSVYALVLASQDLKDFPIEITNYKNLTETANTTKSQVQPFVTREASIPDLDIIKKTYVKLREVAITYNLPEKSFGKISFIKKASVSLVGRNLLYFFPSRYKDVDVDQYTQDSGSGLQTPTSRSYGFNINLSF